MKKTVILLLGAIALLLLLWLCVGQHAPAIEQDLVTRTDDGLKSAGFDRVQVGIDGRDVVLTGSAPSAAMREKAGEIARGIYGVRTVENRIVVEGRGGREIPSPAASSAPYEMNFSLDENGVVISGVVPDEETRAAIVAIAQREFGAEKVQDSLELAPGAPDGWRAVAESVVSRLNRFTRVSATLTDTTLRLNGVVGSEDTRSEVENSISAALPSAYRHEYDIAVPSVLLRKAADSCQRQFNGLLSEQKIHFKTSSAKISAESYPLLDKLAEIASNCPDAKIRIEGHTDARGGKRMNLKLSRARADSVVDYLVGKGVGRERLSAVGYGESRPIADNSTAAGRAKNRRIEFKVDIQGS